MRRTRTSHGRLDDRGVSEILGSIVLIGLVLVASTLLVTTGLPAITDIQAHQEDQSIKHAFQQLDEQLQSLSASEDTSQTAIDLTGMTRASVDLEPNQGQLTITVNNRSSCRATLPLDALEYEREDGRTIAYQAGGVWERYRGGSSAMIAPPDVEFRNGTVGVAIQNMTGTFEKSKNVVRYDADVSRARSRNLSSKLIAGSCRRPDNVTLEVTSPYADAWKRYLADETGVGDDQIRMVDDRTVAVTIPQSKLPERVDDERNDVVNLSRNPPAYMDDVQWSPSGETLSIDKGANNTYTAQITPLDSWWPNVGETRTMGGEFTHTNRPDNQIILVFDISGSMGDPAANGRMKLENTKDAAISFLDTLNFSAGDRVAVVQYDEVAEYRQIDGEYFSADRSAIESEIETLQYDGWTDMAAGLQHANALVDLQTGHNVSGKSIILLTDGKNKFDHDDDGTDRCDWYGEHFGSGPDATHLEGHQCLWGQTGQNIVDHLTLEYAHNATSAGATVYTISYGPGADQSLLERAAESASNGEHYHASSSRQLENHFESISDNLANRHQMIALTPLSTQVRRDDGLIDPPQMPGDTDDVAATTSGSHRFLNVNDPTTPSQFSHALVLEDGDAATVRARTYTCQEWGPTGIVRTHDPTGKRYPLARCTNMTNGQYVSPSNVRIIRDETELRQLATRQSSAWWQPDLGSMLNDSQLYNETSNSYDLLSNQAVVELTFDSGDSATKLLVLFEVGLAEEQTTAKDLITVTVDQVELAN